MVVFVDLEEESEPPERALQQHWSLCGHDLHHGAKGFGIGGLTLKEGMQDGRANPNKNAITEALGCYPYVTHFTLARWCEKIKTDGCRVITSIASHIDLNTLDALSLTCRQIRANLLQFRTQLLTSTLHCENEHVELDPEQTFRYRARAADWYSVEGGKDAQGVGKVGHCARDMVGGCRRCGRVVCRVCFPLTPYEDWSLIPTIELYNQTASASPPPPSTVWT